jgi:hypothetical protein
MVRVLPLFAILSMFATTVESNMEGDNDDVTDEMMVTCNVDENTRNKEHCNWAGSTGADSQVWDDIEAALLQCSYDGMDLADSQTLEFFGVGWELYTPRPADAVRRNLRQERDLRRCTGTCYSRRSSCCLLHSSFCSGKCNRCACSRRLSEEEEIEEVLANRELGYEDSKQDQRRRLVGGQDDVVIKTCVDKMMALRKDLVEKGNFCMGTSITAPITCDANLYGKEDEEEKNSQIDCKSPYSPFYCDDDIDSLPNNVPLADHVCQDFAVHARSSITFAGVASTIQGGGVSLYPGTSITGVVEGAMATRDESKMFAAYVLDEHAAAMKVRPYEKDMGIEMGGVTFTPGLYRTVGAINLAHGTVVTLDGQGDKNAVFIFRAGTTLTTAADTTFELVGDASAENVLWVLGTGATLGANSVLEGSIMAGTAITFGIKSEVHGCALAKTSVTFESEGYVIRNKE